MGKFKWNHLKGPGLRANRGAGLRTLEQKPAEQRRLGHDIYKSHRWLVLMGKLKRERGAKCQQCGTAEGPIHGDHIRELRDGGQPFEPANIQLLCISCHTLKTHGERKRRERDDWLARSEGLGE